ncbi:MAG: PfkB family carbohydrate kinase [Lentisphaeria bacterium]
MGTTYDFIGLGFCSNDHLCLLPRIPVDEKLAMLEHQIQGGGPAATASVAAARLGVSSAFIGTIGDDSSGQLIRQDFQKEKVYTGAMQVRKGADSPIAYCWIDAPSGKRSVAWTRGNLAELTASEVDIDLVAQAKILHLDGHQPKAALAAAKKAHEKGVLVNLDAGTLRDGVPELLPYVDLLIASEGFARQYSGESDLEKAVLKLAKCGSRVVGCTMGEEGSMLYDQGKFIRCSAFKVKVVDTTGCGDVFHAAFGLRYLETQDLYECQRFAAAVSALKCRCLGGRAGIPTRAEVHEFLTRN